jgi:outer membrane protein TolC
VLALVSAPGCVICGYGTRAPLDTAVVATAAVGVAPVDGPEPLATSGVTERSLAPLLESYLERAWSENRAVQAARFEVMAMRAGIPQAKALEDPMVQNGMWPFPSNAPQYSLMGFMPYELMITQAFPWLGTLRLRGLVAEEEVRAKVWALATAQLEVATDVKQAYYSLYASERSLAILSENRELVDEIVSLTRTRLEVGGNQQDVLRAEVAAAALEREVALGEQAVAEAQAALGQLLHLEPGSVLRADQNLNGAGVPGADEALYHFAVQSRPQLQERLAEVARDRHEVELAKKRFYPNVTVGVGYATMTRVNSLSPEADGRDNVGFVLGFNLPIYRGKLEAGVCEAQAKVMAATRRYEAERDLAAREIRELLARVKAQAKTLTLLRDSIGPKSRQALESAVAGYRAGNLDYVTLNSARQELLEVDLQTVEAEAELGRLMASLERAVGIRLGASWGAADARPEAAEIPPASPIEGPFDQDGHAAR